MAFIWVQMEFFLNGRFKSLPLSGIVFGQADGATRGGRRERERLQNQSAKALISLAPRGKGFSLRLFVSYLWSIRSFLPRQLSLPCFLLLFPIFFSVVFSSSPPLPSLPFFSCFRADNGIFLRPQCGIFMHSQCHRFSRSI